MKRLTDYIAESFKRPSAGQNKSVKPRTKDELKKIIKDAFAHKQYNLNFIDTSYIKDMSGLFEGVRHDFDVTDWDVSNVTDMSHMFADCTQFNGDLSVWDVSNVTDMSFMFKNCGNFNAELYAWDVSSVTNMRAMFKNCQKLNCDLSRWNVRKDVNTKFMFDGCDKMKVPSWYRE